MEAPRLAADGPPVALLRDSYAAARRAQRAAAAGGTGAGAGAPPPRGLVLANARVWQRHGAFIPRPCDVLIDVAAGIVLEITLAGRLILPAAATAVAIDCGGCAAGRGLAGPAAASPGAAARGRASPLASRPPAPARRAPPAPSLRRQAVAAAWAVRRPCARHRRHC
jgi:hypothetical protein